jgi:hypothetical protein
VGLDLFAGNGQLIILCVVVTMFVIGYAWIRHVTPVERPDRTWAEHRRGWPNESDDMTRLVGYAALFVAFVVLIVLLVDAFSFGTRL